MKIWGWILIIFGSLSGLGSIIGGANPVGFAFLVLGLYLLHRAKEKKEEQNNKEKWNEEQK